MIIDRLAIRNIAVTRLLVAIAIAALFALTVQTRPASSQMASTEGAIITDGNETSIPEGFRK